MTITISSVTAATPTVVPELRSLTAAADTLLEAMTEAGLDSRRWDAAGPLVSAAAQRLRQALGARVSDDCVLAPSVVREADFAMAARNLLRDPEVVDREAARHFVRVAIDAALALS